ncbi:hypothetical protein MZH23_15400, partial [Escherichia coli]|nr:hypothetical protein [Escherichia coli]
GDEKPRPGFDNWRQPVGQTVNAVSGLPAGRAKRVNPPLTVIFKEKRVRKYELFSHFICLFDSEPAEEQQFVKYEFLSSLYGSEPSTSTSFAEYSFLSCLYGSERVRKGFTAPRRFLSCLYGSELKYYTFSSLLIKQNHLIFLLAPFFILTFQHH